TVEAKRFAASAHGEFGCPACHSAMTEYPHPEKPAAPDCAVCHEDAVAGYHGGVHATPVPPDGKPVAGCGSCHGNIHAVVTHENAASPVHWANVAGTCARCHADEELAARFHIPVVRPVESYLRSVHAAAVAAGKHGAVCSDCHGAHEIVPGTDPRSPLWRIKVPETCGKCHVQELAAYRESVHGEALARGLRDAPVCTDCHGEHAILPRSAPESPVFSANIPHEICGRCHESIRLSEKYGLPQGQAAAFADSYHGLALRSGKLTAANCASCHGVHDIQPSRDPRSHVAPANLPATCGKCHPGAGVNFSLGRVHVRPERGGSRAVGWIRIVYLWLIGVVVGGMAIHNLLDLWRKARRPAPAERPVLPEPLPERMSRALRWQHGLVMLSFPVLVYTGFALKYPEAWWAMPLLVFETRFGLRGWLHRAAAIVLLASLAWHLGHLLVSRRLRACMRGLLWSRRDLLDVVAAFAWALGLRAQPPRPGRFSYVEKAEYWAFLWGSVLMAVTGVILWFENAALRYLPKWITDVATALHFYEAILATLAIVVWHFYWVVFDPDVYPMDASWWHGRPPAARVIERGEDVPPDERDATP
ncbi:MAG TPA: cytochrome b/b6 domain-containing protein, partial [Dongiaceae bacterium]|nr:cytochrome b/b6 domain-containing protein [Dongiaceae bacterium]